MSELDTTSDADEAVGVGRLSAMLQGKLKCDKHHSDKSSCWILEDGRHLQLIPRDFAMWAAMIVSPTAGPHHSNYLTWR